MAVVLKALIWVHLKICYHYYQRLSFNIDSVHIYYLYDTCRYFLIDLPRLLKGTLQKLLLSRAHKIGVVFSGVLKSTPNFHWVSAKSWSIELTTHDLSEASKTTAFPSCTDQTVAGGHDQFQLFGQRLREGFPLALGAPNPWDNTSEAQLTWWFSKGIPPKMAFQIKDLYVESPGWNLNKFDLPFQERDQDQIHITHHSFSRVVNRMSRCHNVGALTFFVSPTLCQANFQRQDRIPGVSAA